MSEMLPKRVIPCLDVSDGRVVKGKEFDGLRNAGDPVQLARRYEAEGADELVFLDISATQENRGTMIDIAKRVASEIFIPFTVGGGVRSVADARALLESGADKVTVNSAALGNPDLINGLSVQFGRQCVVLAIDAKQDGTNGDWQAYAAGGREATGRDVAGWAREGVQRGAGEILLTSIDRDGTQSGYDLDLLGAVTDEVDVPVIASGGAGRLEHYMQAVRDAGAEAVLAASLFHDGLQTVGMVKGYMTGQGIPVRLPGNGAGLDYAGSAEGRPRIAIYDYGTGNTHSVLKALERTGAEVVISGDAEEIEYSDALVLPGVGSFESAMRYVGELDRAVRRKISLGEPVLGICLGEQALFESSEEGGYMEGLGYLPGQVKEIETVTRLNIGWRPVRLTSPNALTAGLPDDGYFYHLHQYAAVPDDPGIILGVTALPSPSGDDYAIPSIVGRQNLYGVQFHPEKSGIAGLRLLRNFVELSTKSRPGL